MRSDKFDNIESTFFIQFDLVEIRIKIRSKICLDPVSFSLIQFDENGS